MKRTKIVSLVVALIALFIFSTSVSADTQTGWSQDSYGRWSYLDLAGTRYENGWFQISDKWYYFDWEGYMCANTTRTDYDTGVCYAFDADGNYAVLNGNGWTNVFDKWYYVENGNLAHGVKLINGNYYYFESGQMQTDEENWYNGHYYYAKADGTLACNEWIKDNYDNWYYYTSDGSAANGWLYVGDRWYYFGYAGYMYHNTTLVDADGRTYVFDDDGYYVEINKNGWTNVFGTWYYAENGNLAYGVKLVNGNYYLFTGGVMQQTVGFYWYGSYEYYIKEDGTLAHDEWISRYNGWYYCISDCTVATGVHVISGNIYCFSNYGILRTNTTIVTGGRYFVADESGACTEGSNNSWIFANGDWYYVNNGEFAKNEICYLKGTGYAFEYSGKLYKEKTLLYDYNYYANYLISSDGTVVSTPGWYTVDANFVYVTDDWSVAYGWIQDEGQWYYLDPYLCNSDFVFDYDTDALYIANASGAVQRVTADGWYQVLADFVYVRGGTLVCNAWIYDGGYWYYMYGYQMATDTIVKIDEKLYYFDNNGHMCSGGWIYDTNSDWLYAYADGTLATGLSGGYYFNDNYGTMLTDTTIYLEGYPHIVSHNGVLTAANYGWNCVDNKWYYVDDDGEFVDYGTRLINGAYYVFSNSVMKTNVRYDGYYYGSDGARICGWIYWKGDWYYADPDNNGSTYNYGKTTIGGVEYCFTSSKLLINGVILYDDELISTNSSGVIVSTTKADNGWFYENDNGYGRLYFKQNGTYYNGWYGDYYLSYGQLMVNTSYYINDKNYYFDKNGLCAYNRWIELDYGDDTIYYLYAKADGTLAYNEWLCINGTWYYFSTEYMVTGKHYISTKEGWNLFAENGAWLGKAATYADGWVLENNNWYYSQNGEFVTGGLYIDGVWYYLSYYDGMLTNDFAMLYDSNYNEAIYYYTASGARANYTGWQFINGNWCYFNSDNTVTRGWITVNGQLYYQTSLYDDYDEFVGIGIVTGYRYINGSIYYFDANGVYSHEYTTDGWVFASDGWYYIADGKLVCNADYYAIDGTYYAFDYSGIMVCGRAYNNRLYGSDGKLISTDGWHYIDGDWYYVIGGYAATGVHLINGVQYCFDYNGTLK